MAAEFGPTESDMNLGSRDRENEESQEIPNLLTEVEPIKKTFQEIRKREDLKELVEPPLRPACEELFDKNIRTKSTSANRDNVENGFAYVDIDYKTLSPENQAIGRQVGEVTEKEDSSTLKVKIPIDQNRPSVADVQRQAEEIAHRFKKQQLSWGYLTIEQLREEYTIDPGDKQYGPESFTALGFYYDEGKNLFYRSEELYLKATEPIV